ncbi:MAG TPA: hypothetical protein VM365_02185 [Gemmatimonadales bacterium]|jgi:hypothetical protein|nr:hypothetical protein [Gemmatimonadales bacterium]
MSIEPGDPETPDPTPEGNVPVPAAIAATEDPVQLTVALVEDERVPEGMVCMGSFRNGRLVARSVMPPEAWAQIDEYGIFDEPVQVVLVARAGPPGVQCQLYAMVPLPDEEDDEPDEPWAASVPGSSYEASIEDSDEDEDEDEPRVAPIPLGHIVRYERDRVHPESLPLEAVDLLRRVIDGKTSEVVDKALADLLGL